MNILRHIFSHFSFFFHREKYFSFHTCTCESLCILYNRTIYTNHYAKAQMTSFYRRDRGTKKFRFRCPIWVIGENHIATELEDYREKLFQCSAGNYFLNASLGSSDLSDISRILRSVGVLVTLFVRSLCPYDAQHFVIFLMILRIVFYHDSAYAVIYQYGWSILYPTIMIYDVRYTKTLCVTSRVSLIR